MHGRRVVLLLLLSSAVGGCGREEVETGTRSAAEAPGEALAPEVRGYNPDSLEWLQEGRPVVFGGRQWRPAGRPIHEPRSAFKPVGEFEGMVLYAPVQDTAPYDHLFFPYGNDVWQALEPTEAPPGPGR